MESSLQALLSIFLILLSAFFVAAEYSLVASRRSKVETLAQNGSRTAVKLLSILTKRPSTWPVSRLESLSVVLLLVP